MSYLVHIAPSSHEVMYSSIFLFIPYSSNPISSFLLVQAIGIIDIVHILAGKIGKNRANISLYLRFVTVEIL